MQQKYFNPKTGMEREAPKPKPSFDGKEKKPAPKPEAKKASAPPAKKAAPPKAAAPQEGIVEQILKGVAALLAAPDASSQGQMQHEDAERTRIMERGAPLDPNAGMERADNMAFDGAKPLVQSKPLGGGASATRTQKMGGSPPIMPPVASKGPTGQQPRSGPPALEKPRPAPPEPAVGNLGGIGGYGVDAGYGIGPLIDGFQQEAGSFNPGTEPPTPQPPLPQEPPVFAPKPRPAFDGRPINTVSVKLRKR